MRSTKQYFTRKVYLHLDSIHLHSVSQFCFSAAGPAYYASQHLQQCGILKKYFYQFSVLNIMSCTYILYKCIQLWEGSREGQWTCLESEKIFCNDIQVFFHNSSICIQFPHSSFSIQCLSIVPPINLAQKLISIQMLIFFFIL